jgi:hypothetical protein
MAWARIDDDFPNHPKIVAAGHVCAMIQVRAICYCSRYLTDGIVPFGAVPSLLVGLPRLKGARNWPEMMTKHGLWEARNEGYFVHDYLDYNPSKHEVEEQRERRSAAGKVNANQRWRKRSGMPGMMATAMATATPSSMPSPTTSALPTRIGSGDAPIPIPSPNTKASVSSSEQRPAPEEEFRPRFPRETFNTDCQEPRWRGHCVSDVYVAAHPGAYPAINAEGTPKQCPHHRAIRAAGSSS